MSPTSCLYPYNVFEQATSKPIYCKCPHPQVIINYFYSEFLLFLRQPTRQKQFLLSRILRSNFQSYKNLLKLKLTEKKKIEKDLKQIKITANAFGISFSSISAFLFRTQKITCMAKDRSSIRNSFANVQSRRSRVWGFLSPFFVRLFTKSFTLPGSRCWENKAQPSQAMEINSMYSG